ncbi:hypothetical protein GCM10010320_74640 [Streptomyces caelestis]|uniref:Uncharacterized protein n=1 Tax=Streptomyces caelestis TaxID=36816 RepID=A0A7W9GZN8_9ACTN|nr:hypothetical protein [Streptomyces caelestis]GGW81830.1 hypothetical protein GCM10010320_74640 [Streptomyces caelestis]
MSGGRFRCPCLPWRDGFPQQEEKGGTLADRQREKADPTVRHPDRYRDAGHGRRAVQLSSWSRAAGDGIRGTGR